MKALFAVLFAFLFATQASASDYGFPPSVTAATGTVSDPSQCDTGADGTLVGMIKCLIDQNNNLQAAIIAGYLSNLPVTITPNAATDGSTTIVTGGTAQNLFSGVTPPNGFTVFNPDAAEDCWISDTATAAANNTGSILVAHLTSYTSPTQRKPIGAVSIVCATSTHKLTASYW